MLFRIVQEQLNNIIKHSGARHVTIQLENKESMLELLIEDDGRGFDTSTVRKTLGLTNIRNRAELFGGKVAITSAPGQGCCLQVSIPDEVHELPL
jgi:signal transduction histidine kinase